MDAHLRRCNGKPKPVADYVCRDTNIAACSATPMDTPGKTFDEMYEIFCKENRPVSTRSSATAHKQFHEIRPSDSMKHKIQNVSCWYFILMNRKISVTQLSQIFQTTGRTPIWLSLVLEKVRYNYQLYWCIVSGGLSLAIAPEVASLKLPGSKILLVDRQNSRRKDDMYLRNLGFDFSRIFADLKDLDLHLLLPASVQRVIFTGKHLCGAATCMSLRAIASLSSQRPHLFISCRLFYW